MLGPTKARVAPQTWFVVAPASPTPDGPFGPTQAAGMLAWPPCTRPPAGTPMGVKPVPAPGKPTGKTSALAPETGAATASKATAADSAMMRTDLIEWTLARRPASEGGRRDSRSCPRARRLRHQ